MGVLTVRGDAAAAMRRPQGAGRLPPLGARLCDRLLFGAAAHDAAGASTPLLQASADPLDPAGWSRHTKLLVTAVYCFGMITAGMMGGAAGPATLQLAEQIGIVHAHNATGAVDTKDL